MDVSSNAGQELVTTPFLRRAVSMIDVQLVPHGWVRCEIRLHHRQCDEEQWETFGK